MVLGIRLLREGIRWQFKEWGLGRFRGDGDTTRRHHAVGVPVIGPDWRALLQILVKPGAFVARDIARERETCRHDTCVREMYSNIGQLLLLAQREVEPDANGSHKEAGNERGPARAKYHSVFPRMYVVMAGSRYLVAKLVTFFHAIPTR